MKLGEYRINKHCVAVKITEDNYKELLEWINLQTPPNKYFINFTEEPHGKIAILLMNELFMAQYAYVGHSYLVFFPQERFVRVFSESEFHALFESESMKSCPICESDKCNC